MNSPPSHGAGAAGDTEVPSWGRSRDVLLIQSCYTHPLGRVQHWVAGMAFVFLCKYTPTVVFWIDGYLSFKPI